MVRLNRRRPMISGVENANWILPGILFRMSIIQVANTNRCTSVPPVHIVVPSHHLKNPIPAERRPARKRLFVPSVAVNTEIRWITTGHFQPTTIKPMCAPADAMAAAILRRYPARWTVPTASGVRSAAAARPSMVRSTPTITIGGAGRATAI